MADRTGRDASLGPLCTPERSENKHGSEEGFLRSRKLKVESPRLGNQVPSTAPAGEHNAKRGESNVTPTPAGEHNAKRDESNVTPSPAGEQNVKLGESNATPADEHNVKLGESNATPKSL